MCIVGSSRKERTRWILNVYFVLQLFDEMPQRIFHCFFSSVVCCVDMANNKDRHMLCRLGHINGVRKANAAVNPPFKRGRLRNDNGIEPRRWAPHRWLILHLMCMSSKSRFKPTTTSIKLHHHHHHNTHHHTAMTHLHL